MKKITKEALKNMLSKKSGWDMLTDGVRDLLVDVVLKHVTTGKWENGNPPAKSLLRKNFVNKEKIR